jgi:hypothetical protein
MSEEITIATMNSRAILIPSGRSTMLVTVVYAKTTAMDMNSTCRSRRCHALIATASAADPMSTRTPVAYAPPCASTSARKTSVTTIVMAMITMTSGRLARVHSGAMPFCGR